MTDQPTERVDLDAACDLVAEARRARILATGRTVPWDEAKVFLAARARGEKPLPPVARKLSDSLGP
ncbi:MAG: CopG family transcriptional regulator [Rhodoferax sp.]|nr:CopG family transcriptional regulator [Rhodoferax sp.]